MPLRERSAVTHRRAMTLGPHPYERRLSCKDITEFVQQEGSVRQWLSEEKVDRNAEIRRRYQQGETITELAREYGLSLQRISQIVHQTSE